MKEWTAILPLVGVGIGWLLNQATARRTERLADQRVIKEVLYFLLELRHQLAIPIAVEAHLPAVVALLRKTAPVKPPVEYEDAIDEMLSNLLRDTFLPIVSQQLASLKESYTTSLLKLSAVDPLNAYRLRGLEEILQLAPQMTDAMQAAETAHLGETTTPPSKLLKFVRQQLEPTGIANSQEIVEDVMQQLASQLNRRTQRGLAAELAKSGPSEEDLAERLDENIQQIWATLPRGE